MGVYDAWVTSVEAARAAQAAPTPTNVAVAQQAIADLKTYGGGGFNVNEDKLATYGIAAAAVAATAVTGGALAAVGAAGTAAIAGRAADEANRAAATEEKVAGFAASAPAVSTAGAPQSALRRLIAFLFPGIG